MELRKSHAYQYSIFLNFKYSNKIPFHKFPFLGAMKKQWLIKKQGLIRTWQDEAVVN